MPEKQRPLELALKGLEVERTRIETEIAAPIQNSVCGDTIMQVVFERQKISVPKGAPSAC